jgi:predicted O-methyltransferase YrrM
MSLLTKLVSGDRVRRSRLHDEKGNFAKWENIVLHGGPAVGTGLLRLACGYRPEVPWIAYTAIRMLENFLNKDSRVLEFGSGMSTIWYAKRAGEVCSVEDNRRWYEKVANIIASKRLDNVTHQYAELESEYSAFMSDDKQGFDLVMVDGSWRSKCIANAAKLLKPAGILYLDNSDKDSGAKGGDMRAAERIARKFAENSGAQLTEITDFAPTQLFVQQGLCIRLPG